MGVSMTPPAQFAAVEQGYMAISLAWPDGAIEETGYRLERSTDNQQHWQTIADLPANTLRYVDYGLARHTRYGYRLTPYNSQGDGPAQTVETETKMQPVSYPNDAAQQTVTIRYTYDALKRLTTASYSDGPAFSYTYDAAGNTLQLGKTMSGQTTTTVYTYDIANQLATAQEGSGTAWQYQYDGNGSLVEMTPGSQVGNGAKRYSYNTAGQFTQVETHDGSAYQPQAEMIYDGQGQRLAMTGYQGSLSLTSHYLLDGQVTLAATASGQTTYYLGGVGEYQTDWRYYLADGMGNVRQVTDGQGQVAGTRSYTAWGEILEQSGQTNLTTGYLGGMLDAATGLIYVGNGQYYDPATGRFLTRDANPTQTNPYVPWKSDPAGAMLAPLALLAMVYGRKKKRGKWDQLIILLVLCGAVGMSLSACSVPGSSPTPRTEEITLVVTPGKNVIVKNAAGTVIATLPLPSETATVTPTPCPTVEIKLTPIPTNTPTPIAQCQVCGSNQYAQMLYNAVLNHEEDLKPGFSVALLFSLAAVESGGNTDPYRNSTTHGGAFQLRLEGGHYHHPYADTPEGYDQNVVDAIAVINEKYGNAADTTDNLAFHFLYTETYPGKTNEVNAARAVLYYNGGMDWWNIENPYSYVNVPANKPYVGNVAKMLESYVPKNFGFSDPTLINILRSVQAVVNAYVPDKK